MLVTVASGTSPKVGSKEGLPVACLEFCSLTVGDLKAKMNWIDADLWKQRALPQRRLAGVVTKARKPEL